MPLHWVSLRLRVCRASAAIVDDNETGEQDLHQCAVRRHHTGQVDEALCGHVYIMQASVLDPAGRPRSVFGDRY